MEHVSKLSGDENNLDEPIISQCNCIQDPFAAVPPALRPKAPVKKSTVRKVVCPGCGLVYSTNRKTDYCFDCEKKGLKDATE